ncbi:CRISPR-associated protein Cas4 [Pyrobaculum neutrophilum]|uniref:CRISPR-associated exonuclease Cas4 n=1 Tax=Pyrobaculum neutrophilum (strain DSM 2338 / JCM 9278 / NBRC 100436 / V24Sta) TaxID=444157 RepID=B1YCK5_PYRNV|nr:CRISPR-associated protein Cas4 [Pyrobaculum neutrophilum]ACB39518.1 CRISPR-associated protein Cas4 [Pyrobaculum neutrophilum V24Sta]
MPKPTSYRPTPWDVLELEWCPRYLWLSKRHGVPTTPSMAKGRQEEQALRKKLAAALGAEPKPVYIDAGWTHGVVDMVARRHSAVPVEIKTGVPRREHKWQLYAEAYLVKAQGHSVSLGVIAYGERLARLQITPAELKVAEALLIKAAEVVEGPPPPPRKTPKCAYCQYRPICSGATNRLP